MLDAAVCGAIFASPNVVQIEAGLRLIESPAGSLVIVKNYTGDKLNFGLAVEKARAAGNKLRLVIVGDDVSIGKTRSRMVGRRGLAGVVLVHKVAGAAAARGLSLHEVAGLAEFVTENLATIGVGLERSEVPGQRRHADLTNEGIELGMGIHNEPGSKNLNPQLSTGDIITEMLDNLLDPIDTELAYLPISPLLERNSKTILLINNLGGLSVLELTCLTNMALEILHTRYSVYPCRVYSGTFLSSLTGVGFSITILSLPPSEKTGLVLSFLDAPTTAAGWTTTIPSEGWNQPKRAVNKYKERNGTVEKTKYSADCKS